MTVDRTLMQERLISIVHRFSQRRILVVGDAVADQFVYGAIDRVSREAPVFILRHEHTETIPGGAANCAINLASLGARVSLIGIAGDDEAGRALVDKLTEANIDLGGFIIDQSFRTTTKVRILAGQLHSTRQQVIRIDYDGTPLTDAVHRDRLHANVREHLKPADAVIMSDYNYGVADEAMARVVREATAQNSIPALADSRFSLRNFQGLTSATPNQDEVEQLLGQQFSDNGDLAGAGDRLRDELGYRALLVTRGSHGMTLLEDGVSPIHLEAVGAREPVDVTGAGDTVMAAYTLALASDSSFPDAARIANFAGGLVVMKRGTASVSAAELEHSILHSDN